ncbi:MAG: serine hydrolase domain-containing protein [Pseudomonadota bacterium]
MSAPAPSPSLLNAEARAEIETLAQDAVDRGFAPGVVVWIEEEDRPPYAYAYGKRDIDAAAPQTVDDLFRIYSMTKPVTVFAAMQLVDDGVMALDDPVSKFLPRYANARVYVGGDTLETLETAPLNRPLTIRDLMRHTAGMAYKSQTDHPVNQLYVLRGIDTGSGADIPPQDGSAPVASVGELAARIAEIPLLHQPGERFVYGNAHDVLGAVIEAASGERLGAFMKQRIFAPLGMDDTRFMVAASDEARMTAAYSAKTTTPGEGGVLRSARLDQLTQGELALADPSVDSVFSKPRAIDYGGAGLVSTAEDFARFARMLLNGGALDGKRILSEAAVAEMTSNQLSDEALAAADGLLAEGLTYGLGVAILDDPSSARAPLPTGSLLWGGAASTNFWIDPENKSVGVVMTQVFGGDFRTFYLEMHNAIYSGRK